MELTILLVSAGFKLAILFVAIEVALWCLRRLDRRTGADWEEKLVPGFEADAVGAGVYYGLRFVGVVLGIAIVLS